MFRNVIRLKKNSFQLSYSTAKQSHKCIVRILYVCMYVCISFMYVFHMDFNGTFPYWTSVLKCISQINFIQFSK